MFYWIFVYIIPFHFSRRTGVLGEKKIDKQDRSTVDLTVAYSVFVKSSPNFNLGKINGKSCGGASNSVSQFDFSIAKMETILLSPHLSVGSV